MEWQQGKQPAVFSRASSSRLRDGTRAGMDGVSGHWCVVRAVAERGMSRPIGQSSSVSPLQRPARDASFALFRLRRSLRSERVAKPIPAGPRSRAAPAMPGCESTLATSRFDRVGSISAVVTSVDACAIAIDRVTVSVAPLHPNLAWQSPRRIQGLGIALGNPGAKTADRFSAREVVRFGYRVDGNPFDLACLSGGGHDGLSDRLAAVLPDWIGQVPATAKLDATTAYGHFRQSRVVVLVRASYDRVLARLRDVQTQQPQRCVPGEDGCAQPARHFNTTLNAALPAKKQSVVSTL
jgi:hypothetical protein